jgi:phosphoribosylanthranilate isomerase
MTRVKVCGITNLGDAERAVEHGAWAIGLIFHPESPRACRPDAAAEIGDRLRRRVEVTGVFVNHSLDELTELAELASLSLLQLHGDEGPAYCAEAARRTGAKVMKAMRVRDAASIRELERFHTDYHLLDAYVPGLHGGTGERFEWELSSAHPRGVPVVLSGGLTPENVGEAIAATRPFAVDSASGTEESPGRKDPAKLEALFRAVEQASPAAA